MLFRETVTHPDNFSSKLRKVLTMPSRYFFCSSRSITTSKCLSKKSVSLTDSLSTPSTNNFSLMSQTKEEPETSFDNNSYKASMKERECANINKDLNTNELRKLSTYYSASNNDVEVETNVACPFKSLPNENCSEVISKTLLASSSSTTLTTTAYNESIEHKDRKKAYRQNDSIQFYNASTRCFCAECLNSCLCPTSSDDFPLFDDDPLEMRTVQYFNNIIKERQYIPVEWLGNPIDPIASQTVKYDQREIKQDHEAKLIKKKTRCIPSYYKGQVVLSRNRFACDNNLGIV